MDLGEYNHCLNVKSLAASIDFYKKLGFTVLEDHTDEKWAVLTHNNLILALYEGHLENNLLNFRGGDIQAIEQMVSARGLKFNKPAHLEADGSWSAEVIDPDGNVIYFNTFPEERETYQRTGRLLQKPGDEPSN